MPPLDPLLRGLARRYRWVEGWERFAARVWLAPLAALAVLVAARLWPLAAERAWALGLGLSLLAGLALFAWRRRISLSDAARRCDRDLGLADRLATAYVMSGELAAAEADGTPTPRLLLLCRQREDAWRRVQGLDPRAFIHLRTARRPALAFVILSVAALALAVLPNPQHTVLDERRQQQRAAAALAQELRRQEEALRQTADPALPADEAQLAAAQTLGRLARRLEDSRGRVEADLAALAAAEEALRQAQDPARLSQGAEARTLAQRLEGLAADAGAAAAASDAGSGEDAAALASPAGSREDAAAPPAAGSGQGAAESPSAAGAGQAAWQALDRLAATAGPATGAGEAERRALAQELRAAAADSLLGDGAGARGLESLAQALETGDEKAAAQAAAAVAQAVEAAEQAAAGAQALEQALGSLDEGRRSLAQAGGAAAPATGGAGEPGAPGEAGGEASAGAEREAGAERASGGGAEGTAGRAGGEGGAEAGAGAGAGSGEQGAAGQGREDGQATEGGNSAGSSRSAGSAGSGSSAGEGSAPGSGGSQGAGGAAGAARGAGAGATGSAEAPEGGAGRGAVDAELVYADPRRLGEAGERDIVPGQSGEEGGAFRQVPARQPGQGAAGRVPFAQVLPAYREAAARALDRAQVPAARRDYVRAYFAQLEE